MLFLLHGRSDGSPASKRCPPPAIARRRNVPVINAVLMPTRGRFGRDRLRGWAMKNCFLMVSVTAAILLAGCGKSDPPASDAGAASVADAISSGSAMNRSEEHTSE